jgi:peptidoglycan/xylan/chitin deacetylase (PgdA/CDA1 family)
MRRSLVRALALALLVAGCDSLAEPTAPPHPTSRPSSGPTIVSLTFDDGLASAYLVRPILAAHKVHATFYLNSGHIGQPGFLTWRQVHDLASDGNEIAGHTALHANLAQVDPAEAQREICDDRVALFAQGYQVTDFAYPFGAFNDTVAGLAQACGYASARTTTHVPGIAETIPPAQPYAIGVGNGTPALSAMEAAVMAALPTGGWVPILFHGVCDGCSGLAIPRRDLSAFLDWLADQRAPVVVKTVREVIGGAVQPAVPGPAAPPPPRGGNALQNPSLENDANGDAKPDCWTVGNTGKSSSTWLRSTTAHSGTYAERVVVTNYADGDARLGVTEDLGGCTPSVAPGHSYVITAWYRSSGAVAFTGHTRSGVTFAYWTKSPEFPASDDWAEARWVTPAVPNDVDGLSFGIAISGNGSLAVDDLGIEDAAP